MAKWSNPTIQWNDEDIAIAATFLAEYHTPGELERKADYLDRHGETGAAKFVRELANAHSEDQR